MKVPRNALSVTLLMMVRLVTVPSSFAQTQFQFKREDFLEPKRKADKIDFFYKASQGYLLGATGLDMSTTVMGLDHGGVETDWAKCFGKRDTFGVVGANVGLNAGIGYLDRKMYQRGGRWRIAATVLNVLKGTTNTMSGIHNIRYLKR